MWPFNKKIKEEIPKNVTVKTIICIPGYWKDITDLCSASDGSLMMVGDFLIEVENMNHYAVEFCERDERMMGSFKIAGSVTRISADCLNEIDLHNSVLYLIAEGGSIEACRSIAIVANKILKAGGLGVKIESTGKAFDKESWGELVDSNEDGDIYDMFVLDSLLSGDGSVYSCGMHNIGLKDTIISQLEFSEAQPVVRLFNCYQVIDKPVILNGQTFSEAIDAPLFRITDEAEQINKGYELFENPFGTCRLSKE